MLTPRMKLGLKILAGVAGVMVLAVVAILFVVPFSWVYPPPWVKWKKQNECVRNLKGWFTAQKAFWQEHERYTVFVQELGFSPERGNRYAYFSGPGPVERRSLGREEATLRDTGFGVDTQKFEGGALSFDQLPERVRREVGISGQCPQCDITLACLGQLDTDPTLDVWTVSTRDRTLEGEFVSAGQPYNEVRDEAL